MGCKNYICKDNDPCGNNAPKDEVNNKAPEKDEVKLQAGDNLPPQSSQGQIKLGSVKWEVEFILAQLQVAKRVGTNVSASVSLRPETKVPGSVTSDCQQKLNDGEAESLLNGVSDMDAIAKAISLVSDSEWDKLIKASIGYRGGDYLPQGNKFGQAVFKKNIEIDYWATGPFEGCEEGTSEDYANPDDGSVCGYGKWTVNTPLFWKRPKSPSLYNIMTAPTPLNALTHQADWISSLETARGQANSQWANALNAVPANYTGPIYLHAGPVSSPNNGANGFKVGLGNLEFGGVTVYANNGDLGNNAFQLKFNAHKWDFEAWGDGELPAWAPLYDVARNADMEIDVINTITQVPYMGQAISDTISEVGGLVNSMMQLINPHITQQGGIIQQIQQIIIDAPHSENQAIETGSISTQGVNVKTSGDVKNINSGKGNCWLARAVYGENNPEWQKFRKYIYNIAPEWQKDIYIKYAPRLALKAKKSSMFRNIIKSWMNTKIRNIELASL